MKKIKLEKHPPSVARLLRMAREDVVLVTTKDGESFLISSIDDFDTEVQLLRQNHTFLTMLNELKKDGETVTLEEAEKRLR